MYFTGFADEASWELAGQIAVTKQLGWECIEARGISRINIHDLCDEHFEAVARSLDEAGIKVNCFGSAIANWAHSIEEPFEITEQQIERTIPRMKRLNSRLIRIMSYAVLKDRDVEDQMEQERFARLRIITNKFQEADIQPVHENCMNYGGMGWVYTLRLIENVPGLKLVYDTGNPVFTVDRTKPQPYPQQSSWDFYRHVKDHVAYVHIKDGTFDQATGRPVFSFPGEGVGDVRDIMADLLASGYDGGISIEPHMVSVAHEPTDADTQAMYDNYLEYGQRIMKIVDDLRR